jgi:DNA polymerase-3 subunit alpha
MAAVLSHEMSNHDKVAASVAESRRLGLRVLPPDINRSDIGFTAARDSGAIRFGLAAIKNLGLGAAERILEARGANGGFASLYDFCVGVGPGVVGKDALTSLIKAGAFDSIDADRAKLAASVDATMKHAAGVLSAKRNGQNALFGGDQQSELGIGHTAATPAPDTQPYSPSDIIAMERELLGVPVTHDPFAELNQQLVRVAQNQACDLGDLPAGHKVRLGGVVSGWRDFQAKNGPMAFVTVQDATGPFEILMFSDALGRCAKHLRKDAAVVVEGKVSHRDRAVGNVTRSEAKVICENLYPLTLQSVDAQPVPERLADEAKALSVHIPADACGPEILEHISGLLTRYSGDCPVTMVFGTSEGEKRVALGERFCVDPGSRELVRSIETLLGPGTARVE